jgi:phosphoglycolate phosphatase
MSKYNTVIFDLDGTLLDTLEDLADAVNYAMKTCGLPERTYDEVRSFVGNGIALLIQRSVPSGTSDEMTQKALAIFKEYYGAHCRVKTKAYDGVLEMLKCLKEQGIKTAIVSNKADFAVKELQKFYFDGVIPVAMGENESAGIKKKPAPEMVLAALRQLDSTVEESVYVGDSEVDIQTANNSNMDAILVSWGFREKDFLLEQGAKVIVDTMDELKREVL